MGSHFATDLAKKNVLKYLYTIKLFEIRPPLFYNNFSKNDVFLSPKDHSLSLWFPDVFSGEEPF